MKTVVITGSTRGIGRGLAEQFLARDCQVVVSGRQQASVDELVADGNDPEVVQQVVNLIDASEYKRRQAAPGIKISPKAFGIGRRYPIVADYSTLHTLS